MPRAGPPHEISDTVDAGGATQLANQMLALARWSSCASKRAPITRLDEVLRTVALEDFALIAQRDLDFGIHTEAAPVRSHEWMLRELTRNLLHNAVRHAPQWQRTGGGYALRCPPHGAHHQRLRAGH